jgi:hypothetical protein
VSTDRTITVTPGDDQPGQHHTDPTGTIAHTGPAAGCTLPGCGPDTATPDADPQVARQIRREPLAVLLSRMQRGVLLPQERDLLRAAVQTELADGDQAREQLAEARALRFGAHDIEVCNQQRAAHTGLREALQSAFGVGDSVSDDDLFECVRQQAADLAAAKAGDAPWIRAYGEDIEHARRGEAEAVRARTAAEQRAEAMTRAMEDTAADALKHRGCHRDLMAQCQRAERAEATLTAVREAVADAKNCAGEDAGCTVDHRDIITDLIDNGPAALGDPQPKPAEAAAPVRPCPHPKTETWGRRRQCFDCREWLDPATPAEPLRTPVIDAAAREIVNAAWRVLFGRR